MKGLKEKVRLIYLPFLVIAICFIASYSLLNWLLFIKGNFLSLKEDIIKVWLPFALPWIPVLIWLRPRIKLLRFKNDNAYFGYQLIAAMAIAVPTMVAQDYLATATGKLTHLKNISEYHTKEVTKYYALKNYFVDTSHAGVFRTRAVNGKRSEKLTISIYVVLPVLEDRSGVIAGEDFYFIGEKYSTTISNKLPPEEENEKIKNFIDQTWQEFDSTNFQRFVYLERLGNTADHDAYNKAINKSVLGWGKDPVVFIAHDDAFENRSGGKFGWIFKAFIIGAVVWFVFLLFPKLHEPQLAKFKKGIVNKGTDYKEMFDLLIPKEGFFVTPIIIDLNILIYLAMMFAGLGVISFSAEDLLHWGGNYRPYTTNGQWWRLLTNIFLHGGLMHVAANMVGLLFVGIFLEPVMGKTKYIIIYLLTGIVASVASIWWHSATVSVGASGAIFGLYGVFLAFLLLKVFPGDFNKAFLVSTLVFVGFNLLMGFTGGIDNAAHIGGLISGFIIGFFLKPERKAGGGDNEEL